MNESPTPRAPWDFSGRTALVTGAGGGMGLNIARDLLAAGCRVTLLDRKPEPAGLDRFGARVRYVRGDLRDEALVARAARHSADPAGGLDYLVNAAGVLWFERDRSALEIDLALWDEVMAINLKSMVHTVRHACPLMKQAGGGAMVHFSTVQCLRGDARPQDAYQASKAGVIALSKSLAVQLAADRVRSNVICPGPSRTPMQARWDADRQAVAALARHIPLGRVGTSQDMANACLFLLSDLASFVTGTELVVDGGLLALP